jgi:hypothetical protein
VVGGDGVGCHGGQFYADRKNAGETGAKKSFFHPIDSVPRLSIRYMHTRTNDARGNERHEPENER